MSGGRRAAAWLRLDYLAHRWIGTLLGIVIFSWFGSGIAMVFYPWPLLTDARTLALRPALTPDSGLIGFARARSAAGFEPTGGRLLLLGHRPVYEFRRESRGGIPEALVDARSGTLLSPVPRELAEEAARLLLGGESALVGVDLLERGDRYMMNGDYAAEFPAWRVRFGDTHHTAVYVNSRGGNPFGVVTRLTRFTTWTGTVPHWFYFRWLYYRYRLWDGAIIVIASFGGLLGLTGLVWGLSQLVPRRRPGGPPLSTQRAISRWHHLAGIGFGVLVITWCLSGVYENLGSGSGPRRGQAEAVRGGAIHWDAIRISETAALARIGTTTGGTPVAIDLAQFDGRPGYEVRLADGRRAWIDAESGEPRSELAEGAIRQAAARVAGDPVPVVRTERISEYDDYYYAGHEREAPLPAWRITLGDREGSRLYLDPLSGRPLGFVDAASRHSRWGRDALHNLDFRFLARRPSLRHLVLVTLLLGGVFSSGTGLLLAIRRAGRAGRRAGRVDSAPAGT